MTPVLDFGGLRYGKHLPVEQVTDAGGTSRHEDLPLDGIQGDQAERKSQEDIKEPFEQRVLVPIKGDFNSDEQNDRQPECGARNSPSEDGA